MKLKYYMRGLGIGIIVTALLMGFATKDSGKMSDEEVKMRAMELGMVEQKTLANIRENEPANEPVTTEAPTQRQTPKPNETEEPVTTEAPAGTEAPVATEGPTSEPVVTEAPVSTEIPAEEENGEEESVESGTMPPEEKDGDSDSVVLFRVVRGDSSESVSRKLEADGLIESASKFNKFLLDNNLSQRVKIGEYNIKKGVSEEEIARILTK